VVVAAFLLLSIIAVVFLLKLRTLKNTLQTKETEIQELKLNQADSQSEITNLENSIKKHIEEISNLKKNVSEKDEKLSSYETQFSEVLDIQSECDRIKEALIIDKQKIEAKSLDALKLLQKQIEAAESEYSTLNKEMSLLRGNYQTKKITYDSLVKQLAIFREDIELIELGFYEPRFAYDDSETFKEKIKASKEKQKDLLREKSIKGAIFCTQEWTVDGSRAKGKQKTEKSIRLTARAFNNECEASIANCTWKNVLKMEERIKKAFDAINKLNEPNAIQISPVYLDEKLKELQLTFEYREKKQREKEEQAEIKAQMREEAKIEAEIKKAEAEAIKEEKRYSKALEVARKELERVTADKRAELEAQIAELQSNLAEAESKHQRAQSMAEQTKQGHVYVISNIGSFGDDVYKIGMTRRLEPMERVKELGDASVPFTFDVHAMIHTNDAPSLEKQLHEKFDSRRLNMVNRRKEFFSASLKEIKSAVEELSDIDVEFIETAVAQDFYETKAMKEQLSRKLTNTADNEVRITGNAIPQFDDAI